MKPGPVLISFLFLLFATHTRQKNKEGKEEIPGTGLFEV
jgi:hypothetical protein